MENAGFSLVTLVLLLPLVGFFLILIFQREEQEERVKWTALITSIITFVASLLLWAAFDNTQAGMQFVTKWDLLPSYNISFIMGVDGLSLLMIVLTTFIMPLAILSSFRVHVLHERGRIKLYFLFMLLLEFAMLGVFMAQDLFVFYIFWEISLVPMYFLIGIWGAEQRVYAAVKFFLYTMAGSILMLLAILYVGSVAHTFSVQEIIAGVQSGAIKFPFDGLFSTQGLLFLGFLIAFAIKVPIWPLHSWLPDAHVQAPTAGSVILAGVMLKLGCYGIVRFCLPMFPQAAVQWAPIIAVLAIIGIIYGAWVSYAQTDVKKLVAYSSVSHLGFVVLGIFAMTAAGLQGGILQMVNHGISTGGLFLVVGMLYERRHTKAMDAYGGIWKALPLLGGLMLIITLSSMGLPGLNGFVGEFTILLGTFGSTVLGFFYTLFATLGVILSAIYLLYMFQKVFMGELDKEENKHLDPLHWQEIAVLIPILIAIFLIGIQPAPFFATMDASVAHLVTQVGPYIPTVARNVAP
ncbi:MAG: NADH-quinone oxidoreductase subunit M [Chloroflexi bacterium]|nr:NADH-quinone oxidoreductase subunit M [Chloroflexota bacterium]